MDVRYLPDSNSYRSLGTQDLRKAFLVQGQFKAGAIQMVYTDADRAITGSAVPVNEPLALAGDKRSMATEQFGERRETGVINVGQPGQACVDGVDYELNNRDALYIARGAKKITFESGNPDDPARFYILSYPAHCRFETQRLKFDEGEKAELGTVREANRRTITKLIHPGRLESCQLVMGITEIHEGSVWNTMGAHTHPRRTEIYTYFDMQENDRLFHFFGRPVETRHLVIRNLESVISPSWSLHSGVSTGNYSFIWGMGGENQDFDDMDFISMDELR